MKSLKILNLSLELQSLETACHIHCRDVMCLEMPEILQIGGRGRTKARACCDLLLSLLLAAFFHLFLHNGLRQR